MSRPATHVAAFVVTLILVAACGSSSATSSPAPSLAGGAGPGSSSSAGGSATASAVPAGSLDPNASAEPLFTPVPDASQAPDTGAGAAAGDVPDNAIFLTYHSAAWRFSIRYVEGWQVKTGQDGVTIRDKDSSETVRVLTLPADLASYVSGTDLPALQSQAGFRLIRQNRVKVGTATYIHLVYHVPAAPDPVTGKQVPSTVDRFYVPGPGLAIISLSTPDGVDNVDAFREMITSFKWS